MTFKRDIITSCYVFIDRGETPLLAGRYKIDKQGLGYFTYGQHYVENPAAFPLDPIHLPFTYPLQVFHPLNGKESFGVLSDSTPDNWGRKLISSVHRGAPENEVEWLLASFGHGVGCIRASGAQSIPKEGKAPHHLKEMEEFFLLADRFEAGNSLSKEMIHFIEAGSSMGGLRPKLTVIHEGKEWIAKINRIDDPFDVSRVEYATMKIAQKAGIIIPNIQLHEISGRPILLVERFDRHFVARKLHYISAYSLINMHKINEKDTIRNYSYMGIADIAKKITADPIETQKQLYRRMIFNTLTGNTDDHMKNHGFLMTDYIKKYYSLSPAFDVLPHLDASQRLQSIGVGEYGREASVENLLSNVGRFALQSLEAKRILQEVQETVTDWRIYYKEAGVLSRDIAMLEKCFL